MYRSRHSMAAVLCLLALACACSRHKACAAVLGSSDAALDDAEPLPPAAEAEAKQQYTMQRQDPASNSTQFPDSADAFLKALGVLRDSSSLFQASTYNADSYSGAQWWSIQQADVPAMQSQAALFANGLKASGASFSSMFAQLLAQGKKVDAARGLAYLLNANLTLSGGCPNPPLDPSFARQLGMGLTMAVSMANNSLARPGVVQQLPLNITGTEVADTALAGAMLAAKSCGPPNSLSSGSAQEAEQKYLDSTCYFIGPVLAPAVHSSAALGAQLNATVTVTEVQDPWASGAVLAAMQECTYGPTQLQQRPSWLDKSIGATNPAEKAMTKSAQPTGDSAQTCQDISCEDGGQPQIGSTAASSAQPATG